MNLKHRSTAIARVQAVLCALLLCGGVARPEQEPTFSELAKPSRKVPGAPARSDVIVRNLRPHPIAGRAEDPHDTLRMIAEFHVTRLEWTYGLDRTFVQKLKAIGVTVGGAIEDDPGSRTRLGRVTSKTGELVTHAWFPKTRLVGCANAPEFREAWLAEAKAAVDSGVDVMQQDDPQMALRTAPPFCYCTYCERAFATYTAQHGTLASYEQFQKDSILEFHRAMHREIDSYAGRHIPFSHNSTIGMNARADWVSSAFDFVNAEIDARNTDPRKLLSVIAAADGMPLVFSFRETDVAANRRFFALTYATGTWMMLPWDVYMPNNKPRYFGRSEEYGDLSGFVRANAAYLDGYELAANAGAAAPPADESPSLQIDGAAEVCAFARATPGVANAPVTLHVIDTRSEPQPFTLRVRMARLGWGGVAAHLRAPAAYNATAHARAQASGDFAPLSTDIRLTATTSEGWFVFRIPAVRPWGIVVLSPAR